MRRRSEIRGSRGDEAFGREVEEVGETDELEEAEDEKGCSSEDSKGILRSLTRMLLTSCGACLAADLPR